MVALRKPADEAEMLVDKELWPFRVMGIWCLRCRQLLEGMILIKKILTIDIGYESLVKIFF